MKVYNGVRYDENDDYQKRIDDAVAKGDYVRAAMHEQQRNAKIDGEKRSEAKTYNYAHLLKGAGEVDDFTGGGSKSGGSGANGIGAGTTSVPGESKSPRGYDAAAEYRKLNDKKFVYNPNEDTTYKDLVRAVRENASFIGNDMLGKQATKTGGIPSSYAYSAAVGAQADVLDDIYDIYAQREAEAYERFRDERNDELGYIGFRDEKEQEDYDRLISERLAEDERKQAEAKALADTQQQEFDNNLELAKLEMDQLKTAADVELTAQKIVEQMINNGTLDERNRAEIEKIIADGLLTDARTEGQYIDNAYSPYLYEADLAGKEADIAKTNAQTVAQLLENMGYKIPDDEDEGGSDVIGNRSIEDALTAAENNRGTSKEEQAAIKNEMSNGLFALSAGKIPSDTQLRALRFYGYTDEEIRQAINDGSTFALSGPKDDAVKYFTYDGYEYGNNVFADIAGSGEFGRQMIIDQINADLESGRITEAEAIARLRKYGIDTTKE